MNDIFGLSLWPGDLVTYLGKNSEVERGALFLVNATGPGSPHNEGDMFLTRVPWADYIVQGYDEAIFHARNRNANIAFIADGKDFATQRNDVVFRFVVSVHEALEWELRKDSLRNALIDATWIQLLAELSAGGEPFARYQEIDELAGERYMSHVRVEGDMIIVTISDEYVELV